MGTVWYALSVRQPWAALLAAGIKSVDIRSWPTARRGRVLIHAGRRPDPRPAAWARVTTPELEEASRLVGGVVGVGELAGCIKYATREAFAADSERHLNDPAWFTGLALHGFAFRDLRPVPFVACPGSTFFFPVGGVTL